MPRAPWGVAVGSERSAGAGWARRWVGGEALRKQIVRLDASLELMWRADAIGHAPAVLATIVSTMGSTYRKAGARMLIRADGSHIGLLSGGCLEADLRGHAEQVLATGRASAVEYDLRGADDLLYGIGAGCEGAMRVLLEPVGAKSLGVDALEQALQTAARGEPAVLMVVHESSEVPLGTYAVSAPLSAGLQAVGRQVLASSSTHSIDVSGVMGRTRVLVEWVAPLPRLLICGCGPDAEPLSQVAQTLGWQVVLVDHRPAYAQASRFPGATVRLAAAADLAHTLESGHFHAVVVMSHHLVSDVAYLRALARHGTPDYVGLLGPAARRRRLLGELGREALLLTERLHAPVGLHIGAVTPEGIALSVISEIHAHLAGLPSRDGSPTSSPASSPAST